jgi:hypothetical protein
MFLIADPHRSLDGVGWSDNIRSSMMSSSLTSFLILRTVYIVEYYGAGCTYIQTLPFFFESLHHKCLPDRQWRGGGSGGTPKSFFFFFFLLTFAQHIYRVGGDKATNIWGVASLTVSLPSSSQINDYLSIAFSRFCSELVHWFPHSTRPCVIDTNHIFQATESTCFSSSEIYN